MYVFPQSTIAPYIFKCSVLSPSDEHQFHSFWSQAISSHDIGIVSKRVFDLVEGGFQLPVPFQPRETAENIHTHHVS